MSRSNAKATSSAATAAAAAMTTPAQLERLGAHLRKLRLLKSGERLEALLQQAAANDLPYAEFLEQVLSEEVAAMTSKNIAMRTAMARFPFVKRSSSSTPRPGCCSSTRSATCPSTGSARTCSSSSSAGATSAVP